MVIMKIFRRASLMAALSAIIWAGMSGGAFASEYAFACSNDNHCYAQMEVDNIPNNTGVLDNINIQCLYYPDTTNVATNEEWEGNGTYWVEAGVRAGYDFYGNYHDKDWFWADKRPNGGGYTEHYNSGWKQAVAGTTYPIEILWAGNDSWDVYGANSYIHMGTSTAQPLAAGRFMTAGTEYTANADSGIRDIGTASGLEYRDGSGGWHFTGPNGGFDSSTPNNYFSHNFDASSSTMKWSGPC